MCICGYFTLHVKLLFLPSSKYLFLGDLWPRGEYADVWFVLGSQAKEDFASPERRFSAIGQGILGSQFWDLEGGGDTDFGCSSSSPLSLDSCPIGQVTV